MGAILGTSVGAAAYSSATVTREATFTVATDSGTALIGLSAGTTNRIVETAGALDISLENLNTDGEFVYGDPLAVDTEHAFSITNNDDVERTISLGYTTAGVTFELFEEGTNGWTDATSLGTVDDSTDVEWIAAASQEIRVVMTVDTTGVASGTDANTLDGTLTFTAN